MSYFVDLAGLPEKELASGVKARVAWQDRMMLSFVDLAPHAIVPEHSHPHEQAGVVLYGALEFTIGSEVRVVKAGDAYLIPGGVLHKVRTLEEATRALDIFSPPREEYK
ncbi:MAG: cupin domain-containing protein [Candidatus Tectomicrobia bacterium]|uniref:Cupin domain-containing protein n=1 Tax=Tectimicrobiota bacterium TaxID=2528274 RepID=A0A932G0E4_UNCTE|nr:cupin domain-containing protein [Candidatus Tectomicrobia bacterium]